MGENEQPLPLNYETLKKLSSAPAFLLGFLTNLQRLQHDGANQKLRAGHNLKLQKRLWHFMPAQRQQTRQTNKKSPNAEPRLNSVCLLHCSTKYFWNGREGKTIGLSAVYPETQRLMFCTV